MKEKMRSGKAQRFNPEVRKKALEDLESARRAAFNEDSDSDQADFDFDFKAVTKGLGFHHDQKPNKANRANSQLKKSSKIHRPVKETMLQANHSTTEGQSIGGEVPSSLKAFYSNKTQQVNTKKVEQNTGEHETYKDTLEELALSSKLRQLGAWSVDLFIIICAMAITAAGLVALSGLSINESLTVLEPVEFAGYGLTFFSLYYFTYFSVLDLGQTPGKALLGIQLVHSNFEKGVRMSLWQSLTRAIVTFFSLLLVAMPLLFDFQGKLSDTKVVKKNV